MQNSTFTERESLLKIYFVAFGIYAISPICLLLFIFNLFTATDTNMMYWVAFLYGTLPCALIGCILSIIGWIISVKRDKKLNKKVGLIATLIGGIGLFAGILGWGLLYVVLGS